MRFFFVGYIVKCKESIMLAHLRIREHLSQVTLSQNMGIFLASDYVFVLLMWSLNGSRNQRRTWCHWKAMIYGALLQHLLYEPRHEKTNKITVRPAKTQISLGIRQVWSESSLSAWRNLRPLSTHWAHSEDWSDLADAQADLSLR